MCRKIETRQKFGPKYGVVLVRGKQASAISCPLPVRLAFAHVCLPLTFTNKRPEDMKPRNFRMAVLSRDLNVHTIFSRAAARSRTETLTLSWMSLFLFLQNLIYKKPRRYISAALRLRYCHVFLTLGARTKIRDTGACEMCVSQFV
jgi:hypothetical protein